MQVVGSTVHTVRTAFADDRQFNRPVVETAGLRGSETKVPSAAATYISASTRLSGAEKAAFIRLLSDMETGGGLNAKLIASVMAIVQLTESTREAGTYPADPLTAALEKKLGLPELKQRAEQVLLEATGRYDLIA